jgi:hypothetical protein
MLGHTQTVKVAELLPNIATAQKGSVFRSFTAHALTRPPARPGQDPPFELENNSCN